jgi:rhodanese-related sulfurtransferase
MTPPRLLAALLLLGPVAASAANPQEDVYDLDDLRVRITESLPYLELGQGTAKTLVMRHQDPEHRIDPPYDKTSRDCPPFCIQPMQIAPGVETIGELEVIDYLKRAAAGEDILIVDSRTPSWTARGIIPGATLIPYTRLDPAQAQPAAVAELLELELGAVRREGIWGFGSVKTLVLYCNGPWCGQSPTNIRALLDLGYPAHKLKWYRGGMQSWEQLGLSTVKPPQAAH